MTSKTTGAVGVAAGAFLALGVAGGALAAPDSPMGSSLPVSASRGGGFLLRPAWGPQATADPGVLPNGLRMPVRHYRVSAGWGDSKGPHAGRDHEGIDLAARTGEPVFAAVDGVIIHAGEAGGYGNMVEIRTDSGYRLVHGHLDKVFVKKGQHVTAGQKIAAVGSTGHSTGPHLHFEVRNAKEKAIDPNPYLGLTNKELQQLARSIARFDRTDSETARRTNATPPL